MAEKTVNTFEKGMIRLDNPTKQPTNSYPFALNATINDIVLDRTSRTNEKSLDLYYVPNADQSMLLGYIWLGNEEYVLFMKHKDGETPFNKIIYINPTKNETRILYDNIGLNFQDNYEIKGTYRINYKTQRVIYWVDGLNDDRVLNIDVDNTGLDLSLISIGDSASKPIIEATVLDTGGSITTGQYFFATSYNIDDNFTTSPASITKPISIGAENYYNDIVITESVTRDFGTTDGDIIPLATTKSIQLDITNLDTDFTSFNLYVIKYNADNTITVKVIKNLSIGTTSYKYLGTEGEIDDSITLNSLIVDSIKYYASEAIIQKENRLIRGNSKLKSSAIDYQSYANNIKVTYTISEELVYNNVLYNNPTEAPGFVQDYKVPIDYVFTEHSISPSYFSNTANSDVDNKSFQRDEVYSLGIGFELIDGTETAVFHIPGRLPNTLIDNTGIGEFNRTYVPDWDTALLGSEPYWKARNTATTNGDLAYWRSNVTYSDGYGYPSDGENSAGKSYIRHHKMPSDVLEPIFRTEVEGDVNATNNDVRYRLYKRNLALKFSNIQIPIGLRDLVTKIKLFYTPRTPENKQIITKGLLIDTYPETDGVIQHIQQPEGGGGADQTRFQFISPDVHFKFKEALLLGSKIKVNSIYRGFIQYMGIQSKAIIPEVAGTHWIRLFNNWLFDTTTRRQATIAPSIPYLLSSKPREELYSRPLKNAIYVDNNFSGVTTGYNLDFTGGQNTAFLELNESIRLNYTLGSLQTAYPDLMYPVGSNDPTIVFTGLTEDIIFTGGTLDPGVQNDSLQMKAYWDTAYYISIVNGNEGLYGKIEDLQYIHCKDVLFGGTTVPDIALTNGDVYIDMHNAKKTWIEALAPDVDPRPVTMDWTTYTDNPLLLKTLFQPVDEFGAVSSISYMTETDINMRMRRDGEAVTERYFPKSYYAHHGPYDYLLQVVQPEYNKIETSYNKQYLKLYFANNLTLDEIAEGDTDIRYSTRIIYSDKQELEDKTDNYRVVRANNYRDLPLNRGPITIFFTKQDKLYAVTRDSLYNVFASNQTIKSETADNIVVGTGEFLSLEPVELISIDGGYGGTSSKFSLVESPFGYLFVDKIKNKCFLFNEQLKDINILGLNEDFTISLYKQFPELVAENGFDNPAANIGIIAIYDPELQRLIVTKKDYKALPAVIDNYVGEYDPSESYNTGDIVLKDGTLMVIRGSEEVEIINESNFSTWIINNTNQYNGDILVIDNPTAGAVTDTSNTTVTYRLDEESDDSFTINQSGSTCASEEVEITRNVYLSKWIGDESNYTCIKEGGLNTGMKLYNVLLRVSDDAFEVPLDANGNPTSVTGLPQDTKANASGDPDYIAPFENLTDCPNTYKFHSTVTGGNPTRNVYGNDGMVFPSAAPRQWDGSMANNIVIENTIPGTTINGWLSDANNVITATVAGDYRVKVNGIGSVTFYTDNGYSFYGFIDFYINVNGTEYPLSPMNPPLGGFTFPYQYRANDPGGSMSHKEATVGYIISMDQTFTLTAGQQISFYCSPRFSAVAGKLGNVRINNTSLDLEITLS